MGYNTDYEGFFTITPPLDGPTMAIFADVLSEDMREVAEEKLEGYTGEVPGNFCDWVINADGTKLSHNGAEKSYAQDEWLQWLLTNIFIPKNFILNGSCAWKDDYHEYGTLEIKGNVDNWSEKFKKARDAEK
jgi:hypothetical protein